ERRDLDLREEEFLRGGVDQIHLVRVEPRPLRRPLERDDEQQEQLLGEEEADEEGDHEAADRPHQSPAQLDQVLDQRRRGLGDLVFFLAHALPPAFAACAAGAFFDAEGFAVAFAAADFVAAAFALALGLPWPFAAGAGASAATAAVGPAFSGSAAVGVDAAGWVDVSGFACGFSAVSMPARRSCAAFSIGLSAFLMSAAGFSLLTLLASDLTSSSSASFSASSNCLRNSPAIWRILAVVLPNVRSMRGKSLGPTTTIITIAIT